MDDSCWVMKWRDFVAEGDLIRDKPCKTWDQVMRCDLWTKNICADLAQDKLKCKKAIR